ncbi:MAG: glycosyltransferase [Cyclobacteriaceae bacterium]
MPNSHNVLYLSYDGLTDPLGQSQILPYLKGLCTEGYHFHVISFEKQKFFEPGKSTIERAIEEEGITWYPQQYHKQPPIFSTLFDLRKMYRLAHDIVVKHDIKMVHCRSYPPGLIGLKLKKKFGVKFLFDIRGFWANERVDGEIWDLSNPIYKKIYQYFKRKEIEMMTEADHIISLTHAGKEEIVSGRLFEGKSEGIDADKITVIPCAVDLELFDPRKIKKEKQLALKSKLGLDATKEVFIYLGSLGTWYLLDEMLLYFKEMLKEEPISKFLFVTKDDPEVIYYACDRLNVSRDQVVITSSNREQVPLHLSIGTKGIFFIKPAYSKKASSAVKMGEMLAMELDIVCNDGVGDVEVFASEAISLNYQLDVVVIKYDSAQKHLEAYTLNHALAQYIKDYYNLFIE